MSKHSESPFQDRDVLSGLPPVVDLATAARMLGIGRTTAYRLARTGTLPCPVFRVGARYRVPTAPLLALLAAPGTDEDGGSEPPPAAA
jgi:excisionase family DNA binding protein